MIPLKSSQITVKQMVDAMDAKFASATAAGAAPSPGGVTPFPP